MTLHRGGVARSGGLRLRTSLIALVLITPLALAGGSTQDQVATGELLVGTGPLTTNDLMVFLVGENTALAGVDGAHILLDQRALGGEPLVLRWSSHDPAQMFVKFHENGWEPYGSCASELDPVREGELTCVVPAGADAVSIGFLVGARAAYTMRYTYTFDG